MVVRPFNRLYFLSSFAEGPPLTLFTVYTYCWFCLPGLLSEIRKYFTQPRTDIKNHEEKSRKLLKYSSIVKTHLLSFISQILGYIQRTGTPSLLTLSGILRNILHGYHRVVGLPRIISRQALAKYLHMHCDVLKYKHW